MIAAGGTEAFIMNPFKAVSLSTPEREPEVQ